MRYNRAPTFYIAVKSAISMYLFISFYPISCKVALTYLPSSRSSLFVATRRCVILVNAPPLLFLNEFAHAVIRNYLFCEHIEIRISDLVGFRGGSPTYASFF